jgi:hypothetical protein
VFCVAASAKADELLRVVEDDALRACSVIDGVSPRLLGAEKNMKAMTAASATKTNAIWTFAIFIISTAVD